MKASWSYAKKAGFATSIASPKKAVDFNGAISSNIFKKLKVGPMKRLYKYYTPTSINLAGGVPMDSTFPFESLQVNLPENDNFTVHRSSSLAINYQRGDGMPALKEWIVKHTSDVHSPPASFGSCVTVGSTDAFTKILTLLQCDSVLFDQYAYGHAVITSETLGKKAIGVTMDNDGITASALRSTVLEARASGLSANVLYLVPCGHNPTGLTMSQQRKRDIYEVCRDLDIIIIEDDAYYYLNFESGDAHSTELPGIRHLPNTFLSIDEDGRVLRLDSLSKFMAPGMRLGWITAPDDFIAKYQLLQEISTQFPSGFSQSVFNGLVRHWGEDGMHKHVQKIQAHYKAQRDVTVSAIHEFFRPGAVSFVNPTCGMFVWLNFKVKQSSFELFQHFADAGVITVPGVDFFVPGPSGQPAADTSAGTPVRLTFAAASPQQIRQAVKSLADCINSLDQ